MKAEGDGAFNELVALLVRNEDGEKHAADVEVDMRRLLMLARDAHLRDQFVQVQGVRRVTLIAKAATNVGAQRLCAGYQRQSVHLGMMANIYLNADTHLPSCIGF
jgi:hypothetical protein